MIIIAAVFRLLAAVFAKGYMGSDDHFLVIEIADGWLKGINRWYIAKPPMRGIFYPYSVTAVMWFLKQLSIVQPDIVMFFVRLSHGLWSMMTISLIYIAVKKHADERIAFTAALMGAIFFVTPFMAVRNLPEFVCQPVILGGLMLADLSLAKKGETERLNWMLSGALLGFAFLIRYQNSVIPLAVFFYLLIRRRWKSSLLFALGAAATLALEVLIDLLSYSPFQLPFINLLKFQSAHVHSYVTNPFYTHLGTILLAFIPPFSFFLIWWVIRGAKKMPVMFWGTVFFLLIHSFIPQKQERFILPILPELMVLGMIGSAGSLVAAKKRMKYIWGWFWAINSLLLIIVTFNYSQKARVESQIQLGTIPEIGEIIVINTDHPMNPPKYYLGREIETHVVHKWTQLEPLTESLKAKRREGYTKSCYIVVFTHKPLQHYLQKIEAHFSPLEETHHITPSIVDALLHFLNPEHNHSKEAYIFRWIAEGTPTPDEHQIRR